MLRNHQTIFAESKWGHASAPSPLREILTGRGPGKQALEYNEAPTTRD